MAKAFGILIALAVGFAILATSHRAQSKYRLAVEDAWALNRSVPELNSIDESCSWYWSRLYLPLLSQCVAPQRLIEGCDPKAWICLEQYRDYAKSLVVESGQTRERLPAWPQARFRLRLSMEDIPDESVDIRISQAHGLLLADAFRAWKEGDASAAAERLIAAQRWTELLRPEGLDGRAYRASLQRFSELVCIESLVTAGLLNQISPEVVEELHQLVPISIDPYLELLRQVTVVDAARVKGALATVDRAFQAAALAQ